MKGIEPRREAVSCQSYRFHAISAILTHEPFLFEHLNPIISDIVDYLCLLHRIAITAQVSAMGLSTKQLIFICIAILIALVFAAALLFAIYATRRARKEDREARAAVLGGWKEIGHMEIRGVPHPNKSLTSLPNPVTKSDQNSCTERLERPRLGKRLSGIAGIGAVGGKKLYEPIPPPPTTIPAARLSDHSTVRGKLPARSIAPPTSRKDIKSASGKQGTALTRDNLKKAEGNDRRQRAEGERGRDKRRTERGRGRDRQAKREKDRKARK
nr:hypothetical protein L203_00713 [Cryptococcus depauperatus CBS 7841]